MNNQGWGDGVPAPIGHNSGEGWGQPTEVQVAAANQPTYEVIHEAQPPTEPPEEFRLRRNAELQQWLEQRETYIQHQTLERDYRARITATLFPIPKKGTQRYDMGGGYKVKLVQTITYSLGDKDKTDDNGDKITIEKQVQAVEAAIIEKHGELGAQILKRLVNWAPTLSGTHWEKIDKDNPIEADIKEMLRPLVTTKHGSPQLEFETPKES